MEATLRIRFATQDDDQYRVTLESTTAGTAAGTFTPPYNSATHRAIMRALAPVMRFMLDDDEERTFYVERMTWRGDEDWMRLHTHYGPIFQLAQALIPKLDTDDFFELL